MIKQKNKKCKSVSEEFIVRCVWLFGVLFFGGFSVVWCSLTRDAQAGIIINVYDKCLADGPDSGLARYKYTVAASLACWFVFVVVL